MYILEGGPYRPEIIVWLELPADLIVGSALIDPNGPPVSFADTLVDASRRARSGQRVADIVDGCSDRSLPALLQRQLNREARTLSPSRLHRNRAVMLIDHLLDSGETQPRSPVFAGGDKLLE
jgi:hypothetical protein